MDEEVLVLIGELEVIRRRLDALIEGLKIQLREKEFDDPEERDRIIDQITILERLH